jgi:hypothetical protein
LLQSLDERTERLTIAMKPIAKLIVRLSLATVLAITLTPSAWAQSVAPAPQAAESPLSGAPVVSVPPTAQAPAASHPPSADLSPQLPVDIQRIKQEAERQPAVKLDEQQLRYYVLILAKAPKFSFSNVVGDYDLMNGPTKGGAPMTHSEFLAMVTPKELNELFGATSGSSFAMFQAAVMNAAGQSLIKKAVQELRNAHNDREIAAIRQRIDSELLSLSEQER